MLFLLGDADDALLPCMVEPFFPGKADVVSSSFLVKPFLLGDAVVAWLSCRVVVEPFLPGEVDVALLSCL